VSCGPAFQVSSEGPPPLIRLLQIARGCRGLIPQFKKKMKQGSGRYGIVPIMKKTNSEQKQKQPQTT
jgi:hypothetical protein